MPEPSSKRHSLKYLCLFLVVALQTSPLFAATADGGPWDKPMNKIISWLTGPIPRLAAIILIALAGILFATGEHGTAFRRWMGIVFGISIAIGATSIIASLGFSGAEV